MPSSVLPGYQKSRSSGGVNKRLSTHKKLPPTQYYHTVSDSRDVYFTKIMMSVIRPKWYRWPKITGSGSRPKYNFHLYLLVNSDFFLSHCRQLV